MLLADIRELIQRYEESLGDGAPDPKVTIIKNFLNQLEQNYPDHPEETPVADSGIEPELATMLDDIELDDDQEAAPSAEAGVGLDGLFDAVFEELNVQPLPLAAPAPETVQAQTRWLVQRPVPVLSEQEQAAAKLLDDISLDGDDSETAVELVEQELQHQFINEVTFIKRIPVCEVIKENSGIPWIELDRHCFTIEELIDSWADTPRKYPFNLWTNAGWTSEALGIIENNVKLKAAFKAAKEQAHGQDEQHAGESGRAQSFNPFLSILQQMQQPASAAAATATPQNPVLQQFFPQMQQPASAAAPTPTPSSGPVQLSSICASMYSMMGNPRMQEIQLEIIGLMGEHSDIFWRIYNQVLQGDNEPSDTDTSREAVLYRKLGEQVQQMPGCTPS